MAMADPQSILEPSLLFPFICVQHLDIFSGRGLLTQDGNGHPGEESRFSLELSPPSLLSLVN